MPAQLFEHGNKTLRRTTGPQSALVIELECDDDIGLYRPSGRPGRKLMERGYDLGHWGADGDLGDAPTPQYGHSSEIRV